MYKKPKLQTFGRYRRIHYTGVAVMCLCSIFLFSILPVSAALPQTNNQNPTYSITGKVTDEKGLPLPGVTIRLDGTTSVSTASDNEGNFSIRLSRPEGTLVFTCIGYETQKVKFIHGKTLNVKMAVSVSTLDEVQVVAYGSQNKREVVGAMSVLKAADIQDIPSPSIANLMQGKVVGASVINMTGAPGGGGTSIIIRGFNSLSVESSRRFSEPLWVVDGVPVITSTSDITGTNALSAIDPKDIESISVLKDAASASIYGSRAANGVILVKTKQGRYNQKPEVRLDVRFAVARRPPLAKFSGGNRYERRLRLKALENLQGAFVDPETGEYRYADSYWDSYKNNTDYDYFWNKGYGADVLPLQDSLNPFYNNASNFFDYFLSPARTTDASLSISGGAERVAYNVSAGYYDEKGILEGTGFTRMKLSSNLQMRPIDRLESNLSIYLSYSKRDRAGKGKNMLVSSYNTELEKLPDFLFSTSTLSPGPGSAPFEEMTRKYNETKEKNDAYRLRASFNLAYTIVKGLKIKSSLAVDFNQNNQHQFLPASVDPYAETFSSDQIARSITLLNENLLTYTHTFGDSHSIDLLAGLSFQSDEDNSLGGFARRVIGEYATSMGNVYDTEAARVLKDFASDYEKSTMVGLFARANYNYKQRYLFSASVRRDASSKFGEDVRWATFPSFALGYVFSEEPFLDWTRGVLDYAKLRASWGMTGRQFDQPYISYGLLIAGGAFLGNPTIKPVVQDGLMNRHLTWEETSQFDVGIDADFFDHRISISADYYHRYTDKLLYKITLPGNHGGYRQQWRNAFGIVNEGIEFQIKGDLIRTDKLRWDLTFNIAKNWNLLKKATENRDFQVININGAVGSNVNIVGKSLNQIYVFNDRGIYQSEDEVPYRWVNGHKVPLRGSLGNNFYRPGDRIIEDVDGNNRTYSEISLAEDRIPAGSPLPTVQGGILSSLKWKGFDVNVTCSYFLGRHILNAGKGSSLGTSTGSNMVVPYFADMREVQFWEKPGDNTGYPANRAINNLLSFSTLLRSNVEKVNFLRLKSLTIGYTLPGSFKRKAGFGMRIFLSGENLLTWTNYSGADPESVDIVTGYDDLANYPIPRKFTAGLSINF